MKYQLNLELDADNKIEIADLLQHIEKMIRQGYTSGIYPNWDLVDTEKGLEKIELSDVESVEDMVDDREDTHEHEYDENGYCVCGQIQEPDDFSGGSLGNDDR